MLQADTFESQPLPGGNLGTRQRTRPEVFVVNASIGQEGVVEERVIVDELEYGAAVPLAGGEVLAYEVALQSDPFLSPVDGWRSVSCQKNDILTSMPEKACFTVNKSFKNRVVDADKLYSDGLTTDRLHRVYTHSINWCDGGGGTRPA